MLPRYDASRKYYAGDGKDGSRIVFRLECDFRCGIRVGITRSYQPLGLADVSVDGTFAKRLDGHDAFWKQESLKWSIYSEQDVTRPLALDPGTHVVADGEDVAMVRVEVLDANGNFAYHLRHIIMRAGILSELAEIYLRC